MDSFSMGDYITGSVNRFDSYFTTLFHKWWTRTVVPAIEADVDRAHHRRVIAVFHRGAQAAQMRSE